jgi:uncharacterized radical SAM superfamily Fe-S cluster-containing enzyme
MAAPVTSPKSGMPIRPSRVMRYVDAFCPACHDAAPDRPLADVRRLAGHLAEVDGEVWLVRGCPEHGRVVTLYDESAEILEYLEEWTAPTKSHVPDTVGNFDPVPQVYLRGLGEMQTQHTCILLEDITQRCNLRCPTCFADSSPELTGVVPLAEILANIDQRLARENGRLDVVMLSGGEPTLHPDFEELLGRLRDRNIVRVLVNTNGVLIARSDHLVDVLARNRSQVEVYLQFDGLRKDTYRHHRNADLRSIKRRALDRLSGAGVFTTLTMTTSLGVNDDEIGAVVGVALETPYVGGVTIQPVFGSGRATPINPYERLTHTGVLARLGPQTDGLVTWRDLTALPCSHPHCCSVGYLVKTDEGEWRSMVSMIGHDRLKEHLGLVANRIADHEIPDELRAVVQASLLGLLSEQTSLSHPSIGAMIRDVCETCDLGISSLLRLAGSAAARQNELRTLIGERIKRITIKPFMDMNTMIEERLIQCCVHVGTRSEDDLDQCAPFCAVQAWAPLGRTKLAEVVGERAGSVPLTLRAGAPEMEVAT